MLIEDEALRAASLHLVQRLREAGKCVDYPLAPAKPDKQFKRALDLGARRVVRLEAGADGSHRAWVKELSTRSERVVALAEITALMGGRAG